MPPGWSHRWWWCWQVSQPESRSPTLTLMMVHVGIDTIVGAVPFLGAVFDLGYKANTRNLRLIERDLADRAGSRRSAIKVFVLSAVADHRSRDPVPDRAHRWHVPVRAPGCRPLLSRGYARNVTTSQKPADREARAVDGRVPGRRGQATRTRLLEQALAMLASTSYRDLKVVDIARGAGTSPATFYQYFPDAEAALRALADDLVEEGRERLTRPVLRGRLGYGRAHTRPARTSPRRSWLSGSTMVHSWR